VNPNLHPAQFLAQFAALATAEYFPLSRPLLLALQRIRYIVTLQRISGAASLRRKSEAMNIDMHSIPVIQLGLGRQQPDRRS
jgi:hypothetical protein